MDDNSLRFQTFPSDTIQRTAVRPRKWTTIHFELRSSLRLQFKLNTASSKMKHNSLPGQTFSSEVIHRTVLRPSKWTTIHFGFGCNSTQVLRPRKWTKILQTVKYFEISKDRTEWICWFRKRKSNHWNCDVAVKNSWNLENMYGIQDYMTQNITQQTDCKMYLLFSN